MNANVTDYQQYDEVLATNARLLAENIRLTQYIERLEAANTSLHQQFEQEQQEREALVEMGAIMLGEFALWCQKIDALRGKGTPRSVPRIATDNEPRFGVAGVN